MRQPLVTVGLQFFNSESTLELAIRSILSQTYANWELILHDDGSDDRGLEAARRFRDERIRVYTHPVNRTRSVCLNESIQIATGSYYALMDADDVAYPDRIAKQVAFLESHASVDLLGGAMIVFRDDGEAIGKRQPPRTHWEICARPWAGFPMAQPTFLGRTEWFREWRYDRRAGHVQDQDLLLRSYRSSRFANLPDIVMGYREPQLDLGKIMKSRYLMSRCLVREFWNEARARQLLLAVAGQLARAGIDVFAVGADLGYRILRHRARPISREERQTWVRVWESVNRL